MSQIASLFRAAHLWALQDARVNHAGSGDPGAIIAGVCFWLVVFGYILVVRRAKGRAAVGGFWRDAANWSLFGCYLSLAFITFFVAVAAYKYFS